MLISIDPWIPVFKWYTGTTYISVRRLPTAVQCTDPKKDVRV